MFIFSLHVQGLQHTAQGIIVKILHATPHFKADVKKIPHSGAPPAQQWMVIPRVPGKIILFTLSIAPLEVGAHLFSPVIWVVGEPWASLLRMQDCWSCIVNDDVTSATNGCGTVKKLLQWIGPMEGEACKGKSHIPFS